MLNYSKSLWLQIWGDRNSRQECTFNIILYKTLLRPLNGFTRLDIDPTLGEIKTTLAGFEKWAKQESAPFSINFSAMRPVIRKEPKGVVLIISPFNYPLFLTLPLMVRVFLNS